MVFCIAMVISLYWLQTRVQSLSEVGLYGLCFKIVKKKKVILKLVLGLLLTKLILKVIWRFCESF